MTLLPAELARPLWLILAGALLVRIAIACWPVIHHPDEVWQYLEPAYHVAVGPWVTTWEFRAGARSWLLPILLSGPLALGHLIAPGTALELLLPRLACALVSLLGVLGAASLGARLSRTHALAAALLAAFWYEFAYFGPRTLSEPLAVALFLAAAALLYARGPRETIAAGFLLALGCCLRFQYAPAALIFAVLVLGRDAKGWGRVAAGALGAAALSALADLAMGAPPFAWMARNAMLNLVAGRSAEFGTSGPFGHVALIWSLWGWGTLPIAALAVLGARRYPALMVAALVNLAVHSLIPHKEYRFVLLTTCLLVLLAAIGSVDLAQRWRLRHGGWALAGFWLALCGLCAGLGDAPREWGQNARLIAAWRIAGQVPGVCGVAQYRSPDPIAASHALFGRSAPIYAFDDRDSALQSRAFNVALAPARVGSDLTGFSKVACPNAADPTYCVYLRPGPCARQATDAPYEINRVLARQNH